MNCTQGLKTFLISILILATSFASAGTGNLVTPGLSNTSEEEYLRQCLEVKKFLVKREFSVECNKAYHHYNSQSWRDSYQSKPGRTVKIGNFNLLHPGNTRTAFKDLNLVARIMDKYDIIAAVELLPVIGRDLVNNENVVDYLSKNSSSEVEKLYRAPGYFKILQELRKRDKSWSLILTPVGEAAKANNVHELAGFYYRSSVVRPINNDHCQEYYPQAGVKPFACFPRLGSDFMEVDSRAVFSRRPFMGSFKSGNFDFTLMTSHVVFNSPEDPEDMKKILRPAFGISHYLEMNEIGFNSENYARFAEAKVILEVIENLKYYYEEQDVIYAGDMNLPSDIPFWTGLLRGYTNAKLLVDFPTTLTKTRFDRNGNETYGLASNYDHFIVNSFATKRECANSDDEFKVGVQNFMKGNLKGTVTRKYSVRGELRKSFVFKPDHYDYSLKENAEAKINRLTQEYREMISSLKTVSRGEVVLDDYRIEKRVSNFKRRMFYDQLKNVTFYKIYQEVVSDHLPTSLTCRTHQRDDD